MFEKVNEPVDTLVSFSEKGMRILAFLWHHRRYSVEQINLVHRVREGADWLYYYAISSGASTYRLSFSTRNLRWRIVEIYSEG
ncbi:MAG: hypothetical protein AB9903_08740 [Vulcanimicrobiota bacterium]